MKCKARNGKLGNYKVRGMDKDLFIKSLIKLYKLRGSIFSKNIIVIINDRSKKYFLNNPVNVVLFDPWSFEGYGARDGILIGHLLPWIRRLHSERP